MDDDDIIGEFTGSVILGLRSRKVQLDLSKIQHRITTYVALSYSPQTATQVSYLSQMVGVLQT